MSAENDPFRNLPNLRDKILHHSRSSFREIDFTALDQTMRDAGFPSDWRRSDEEREASRIETLEGRLRDDLWVFAYGSLMWDPAFRFDEVRTAVATGYQRSFCLKSELGRGTPEKPGLIAGLNVGGNCHGLAFRIDRNLVEEESRVIWAREMIIHAYIPKFIRLTTPMGPVEALAFVVDHTAKYYLVGMSMKETANLIATGVGVFGSSLDYLESLAGHFQVLGIQDDALFRLRDMSNRLAGN